VPLKREVKKRVAASERCRGVRGSTVTRWSAPTLLDELAGKITANAECGEGNDGPWFMDAPGMVEDEQRLLESADEESTYLSIHRIRWTWEGPLRDAWGQGRGKRVGSRRALLGADHRGKAWKPSQGFHHNPVPLTQQRLVGICRRGEMRDYLI